MRVPGLTWALLGLCLVWMPSCKETLPRTQIMVVLDAEQAMRGETDSIEVIIKGSTGREGELRTERFLRVWGDGADGIGWPRQVAVGPLDDDASRIFEFVATARTAGEEEIGRVRAIGGYVEGKTLMLVLVMEDACHGELCTEETTCVMAECVSAYFEAKDLPEYDPNAVPDLADTFEDASVPDAGALDAGAPDLNCDIDNGGCDPLTSCSVVGDELLCGVCPLGYTGDGYVGCEDIDECAEPDRGGCDPEAPCTNTEGGFRCGDCPEGFTGGGDVGCQDINECADNRGGCDAQVDCTNTPGSRVCGDCPSGYTGSGESSCLDIDECAQADRGGCDALVTCDNTVGFRTCGDCPGGYNGDGETGCTDIDECAAADAGGCDPKTTCENVPGSRNCTACPVGYAGDGEAGCRLLLDALQVSTAMASLDPSSTSYDVDASLLDTRVVLTPEVPVAGTVTIDGMPVTSGEALSVALGAPGETTMIEVVVSEPGQPDNVYTVNVTRGTDAPQEEYAKADVQWPNAQVGSTVALDGDRMAVLGADGIGTLWTYQRIVDEDTGTVSWQADEALSDDSIFGQGLALDGEVVMVHETSTDTVWFFSHESGSWQRLGPGITGHNTDASDLFGRSIALQGDTVAIGAPFENNSDNGVYNGDPGSLTIPDDETSTSAGAVYVFTRSGDTWNQTAYLKAPNADGFDFFGWTVVLDGDWLAVGAIGERGAGQGVGPTLDTDNGASSVGAVYVYRRVAGDWVFHEYLKGDPSRQGESAGALGTSMAMDGETLAVTMPGQDALEGGINPGPAVMSGDAVGAVFVYRRSFATDWTWTLESYIKEPMPAGGDRFANSVALQGDLLALGFAREGSDAGACSITGGNDDASRSGGVYVLERTGTSWAYSTCIKASNLQTNDFFGTSVALDDGTLVVGAPGEDSDSTGVGGAEDNDDSTDSGAVYVF